MAKYEDYAHLAAQVRPEENAVNAEIVDASSQQEDRQAGIPLQREQLPKK